MDPRFFESYFQEQKFDLVEVAAEIEKAPTDVPTYQNLFTEDLPAFTARLNGVREELREPHNKGKLNLIVIGCGGTFQSAETDHGYAPSGSLKESFDALNLPKDEAVNLTLIDLMNLDSSQMNVDHWRFLAKSIIALEKEAGDLYDGIIVTHGTDTMSKGASYLSFMLQGFPKSIIFTGSQVPARKEGTDAKDQMERAIITAKLAANPNRKIAEVMVACGLKIARGTWSAKQGDMTTNAFAPWNQPNQAYDANDWERAAADGTLDRLAPALLDFSVGKSIGSLEFAGHARDIEHKGQYRPFTEITKPADIVAIQLSDMGPRALARYIQCADVSVLTQLGSATADDRLVQVALAAANRGKAIIFKAPFADSTVQSGTYAAGAAVSEEIPYVKRPLPIINTSPDALSAKANFLLHSEGIMQNGREVPGLGIAFLSDDLRRYYDAMATNIVGELV